MRNVERIGFVLVLFCTVALLERAGAQDGLSGMSDGDAEKPSGKLSTSELEITAPDGRVVMRLSAGPNGGGQIRIYNRSGKQAIELWTRTDQGGEVVLYERGGSQRVGIAANEAAGFANYYGASGKRVVYIGGVSKQTSGTVNVYHEGKVNAALSADRTGSSLGLYNTREKLIALLGTTTKTNVGILNLYEAGGSARVSCEATSGGGLVLLKNKAGRDMTRLGPNSSGGGYVLVNNGMAKRAVFLGSTTGNDPNEGVLELLQPNGKLGVVARAFRRGPYVTVYDTGGRARKSLR